jgi:LuxR family transcriptional regulator, maltose regulon positive regulatory protein
MSTSATPADIVSTKLHAPQVPAGLVARPRLAERLGGDGARVVLVSAPAGFGKTVATLDWLRRAGVPHAWLSLDRLDNEPRRFFAHLAAAVETMGTPEARRAAARLRALGTAPAEAGPSAELLDALAALGFGTALVLDDLHQIEAPPVLAWLQALIDAPVAGPRWVLLTRLDPPLALGRLRVAGGLLELREADLRFLRTETADFFAHLLPAALESDLVDLLAERTEGWVAGLRMAALALQRADDPRAVVEAFHGTHRFVVDYLVEEALARQGAEVQRFLMETSVLPRFTAGTCAAVTGNAGAAELLQAVEAANLFLVPLGEERQWFRYHHLFAELLEFRLRRLHPERPDTLHERASRWFAAEGDIHQALEHAARMRSPELLVELLDAHGFALLARSELGSLGRWANCVADPLARRFPNFLIALGWLRTLTERAPDLEPLLRAAAAAIERPPAHYDAEACERSRAELEVLRAFALRFAGRLEESFEVGERALEMRAARDAFPRGRLLYNQARIHTVWGRMRSAAELLERSLADNLAARNFYLVLTGLGQQGAVLAQTEGVTRARESLEAALAFARERGLAGLPAFAAPLYHLGHAHYLADDLDAAEDCLQRAVAAGAARGYPEGNANGLVGLARVAAARGQFDAAHARLAEAAVLAHDRNVLLLDTTIELERARLALLRGEHVGPRLEARPAMPDAPWTTIDETAATLCLWSALAAGDAERTAALATRLRAESEPRGRGVALCVARLAGAALDGAALKGDDRWAALDEALSLAAARGYVRPLLDGGEPVRALLQAGLARRLGPAARAHARLLLDRLETPASVASADTARDPLIEPLTEREQEVLDHLLRGLSNKAIARALYVSAETVKTHLKHVYAKLGAGDRREAAARARQLGLASGAEPPAARA